MCGQPAVACPGLTFSALSGMVAQGGVSQVSGVYHAVRSFPGYLSVKRVHFNS